jgi:hypothetical protein
MRQNSVLVPEGIVITGAGVRGGIRALDVLEVG